MVAISHPAARRFEPTDAVYRRRQLVAAALLLLLVLTVTNLVLTLLGDRGAAMPQPVVERSVVVQPGDTVWSIAESLAAGDDVRPIVDAIVDANGSAALEAGDRLVVVLP